LNAAKKNSKKCYSIYAIIIFLVSFSNYNAVFIIREKSFCGTTPIFNVKTDFFRVKILHTAKD